MEMKLSELLLAAAKEQPAYMEKVEELTNAVKTALKERHSLVKMKALNVYAQDTELLGFVIGTFKKRTELPSLADRDYKPYMVLIACSREYAALCYLCNDLIAVYEQNYRTRELLFFCDLIHAMKKEFRLNEIINRVCDYFFRERRNQLFHKEVMVEEKDLLYAESKLKELDKAVFRMKVKHYRYRTFVAEELARLCGMGYSLFRYKFKKYYDGISASEWLRRDRIKRIEEDMEYRVELPLKEVAERNDFPSASNFADFCQKQTGKSPSKLKAEGYEKWEERRLAYWNPK
ncbi:bacterial regulatory helix-turn-helix s, AraC family protein [Bacteroides fragilis str. S24L26]|uniref:helix-turn-helix domain-containing protein n=1 Tax=Bacteroides fragilis TaxID=817 RepID=UPI000451591B|nr:helix-turn-helix domain-containing protein [Bacteroides fragilis]EYA74084.1 bacterial regulatory helix-turn-helix s, AraC family protein [Bacteroides fragilis str. S24L26]EYA78626.1 bacterial regulatory helix-turn-helix s, AraC family protein [Bacteroides fragilis str. S24L34]